ncbi:hypothetical protein Taro_036378 [Colocasia esculenta]|uniref:Uncharacterized protein n=1 Tax=Colocasia esculenta TaxID=4460 RepID=A0A843WLI2_COLES|nr:hypothetical protein [Colocasia esculenta]
MTAVAILAFDRWPSSFESTTVAAIPPFDRQSSSFELTTTATIHPSDQRPSTFESTTTAAAETLSLNASSTSRHLLLPLRSHSCTPPQGLDATATAVTALRTPRIATRQRMRMLKQGFANHGKSL